MGLWGLGPGDRHAIPDLVEAVVASSIDLLLGVVLGNAELPDHRQRRELLVFLCLVLRDLRLHLCFHDTRSNAV